VTDLLEHWFSYAADIFDYALGVETVVMMGGIMYGEPADEREAQERCCQLLSRFFHHCTSDLCFLDPNPYWKCGFKEQKVRNFMFEGLDVLV
jgi:hypothetical protein